VILKNIHLAPHWIDSMEKKLHRLTPHANFRLILTMEINPCISTNLIRMSNRLIYEAPAGMKASLKRTLASMPEERMSKAPAERSKLYLLVAWLHGVILERLRYTPLGWSKKYEFNESDLRATMDCIDQWVDMAAQGKSNLSPDKIPWTALRTLLLDVFYGGRIDNDFDKKLLAGFLEMLFSEKSFASDFDLVNEDSERIAMPEGFSRAKFMTWVDNLPADDSPVWLGLPATAEVMLREEDGRVLLRHLLTIQAVSYDDSETEDLVGGRPDEEEASALPGWMKALKDVLAGFLRTLPESCPVSSEDASRLGPVQRCLKREAIKCSKLLKQVRVELEECLEIASGTARPTVFMREMMRELQLDHIPSHWKKYPVKLDSTRLWIKDLTMRVKQLIDLHDADLKKLMNKVWMGGLMDPTAYFTATRQACAQAKGWALERLELLVLFQDEKIDGLGFTVEGMVLDGAKIDKGMLAVTPEITNSLPTVQFMWTLKKEHAKGKQVLIPIYLNSTREHLYANVDVPMPGDRAMRDWYQRGAAMCLWNGDSL
jgi:dynein heavy chain 1